MDITAEELAKERGISIEAAAEYLEKRAAAKEEAKRRRAAMPERDYSDVVIPTVQEEYDKYIEELDEEECHNYYMNYFGESNKPKNDTKVIFNDIEVGKIKIKFRKDAKEVGVCFKTSTGQNAYLISKQKSATLYNVRMQVENDVLFNFSISKSLTGIGKTKACDYYDLLYFNMEEYGVTPSYEGADFKIKFNKFIREIKMADAEVREVTNSYDWQKSDEPEEKLEEIPTKTWAEVSGSIEEFNKKTKEEAKKLLDEEKLLDIMLDVAELKVVKQRSKIGLTALMSISSFMETSIHNIITGPPGVGKSAIMDIVFDLFPKQWKESIGKSSTPASLLNMTKYKEGSNVLSKKLIRLGDLGNEEELKNAAPMLGILREIMSEGSYDKNFTDTSNDRNMTQKLRLEGIGSVQLSTIESDVESQYSSRAIISSPDDSPEIAHAIREFQLDDFQRMKFEAEFKKKRPIVACAIDIVAKEVKSLEWEDTLKINNPYASHMDETFKISANKNANRNRQNIRDLAKSVTLCNIKNRDKYINDEWSTIVVVMTPEDYLSALTIMGKPIKQMLSSVSPQHQSYVRYISETLEYDKEGNKVSFKANTYFDDLSDSEWCDTEDDEPCFTRKDIMNGLNASDTTSYKLLEQLVDEGIVYKKKMGVKNVYFPTEAFHTYSKGMEAPLFSEDELKEGSKLHNWAKEMYEKEIQKLLDNGFKKM